jgi:hypothetical protein
MLVPSEGKDLLALDFAAIEARVLAWLAGQRDVLAVFAGHGKIYEYTAAKIYNGRIETVTPEQRFIGKVACIAEGELVLTEVGLIPIEQVPSCVRVWDGVEWVSHDGPIFQGEREVIQCQGLMATTDHQVFTGEGQTLSFGDCAAWMVSIVRTGRGVLPVLVGDSGRLQGEARYGFSAHSKRRVWDLLNAGPRNRFTVSGVLVSNCLALGYGGGRMAFAKMAKQYGVDISEDQAEVIKSDWRDANPFIWITKSALWSQKLLS